MKIALATLAMCSGLLLAVPVRIIADTASPALTATMMCRPAVNGEKPAAMMGSKGIVCKSIPKMSMSKMGPNTTGMDAAATNAAWRNWLSEMMSLPQLAGGGAGG